MTERDWTAETDPVAMLVWLGERASHRRRQLFCLAVWARVAHLLTNHWCRAALPMLAANPDANWGDTAHDEHERFDEALTELDSELSNRFWDLIAGGDRELEEAWLSGTEGRLTTWIDPDSVRAGAAVVVIAVTEGWVRSLSGSNIIGVTPAQLALRVAANASTVGPASERVWRESQRAHAELLRDIFGNPSRPAPFAAEWRTDNVMALARQMYDSRDFSAMPILADALQDAVCNNEDILNHCRDPQQVHVCGCWVVDLVLGKE